MGVLDEVAEGGAEAGRDEVGGVAEEDCRSGCGLCGGAPGSLGVGLVGMRRWFCGG